VVAARDILQEAVERFPGDAMTHFNLGCIPNCIES
jgi:hypothetical protein